MKKEKEVELYLDNRFLEIVPNNPEELSSVLFFLREKSSGSGFPIFFKKHFAQVILDSITKRKQVPADAYTFIHQLILHASIKVTKMIIFEIKDDQFHTRLYFLINKKEFVAEVNNVLALSVALYAKVPILISEKLFIEIADTEYAEDASNMLQQAEDEAKDKNNPTK